MTTIPVSAADARVNRLYEISQEYRAKGYRVIVGPSQHELPEFLRGFRPDLLATTEDDRAVIEVKQRRALIGADEFARMAEIIDQQPGWRLELVLVPSEEEPEVPLPDSGDIDRIRALLAQATELRDSAIAIVPAVAAFEQAMIMAAACAGIDLPSASPSAGLKTLFAYGFLDNEAYETIETAMKLRNGIVHGQPSDVDARPWVDTIAPIAEELIAASTPLATRHALPRS